MNLRLCALLGAATLLILSGCGTSRETAWPAPRPLGQTITTDRPSVSPETGGAEPVASPPVADSLSLAEALALGVRGHPALQAVGWEVRAREARTRQAGLWPNPEVELEAEEVSTARPFQAFSASEQVVSLSQHLPISGRPSKRARVAAAARDLAGWAYETARLTVVTQIATAFAEVLAEQRRLRLTDDLLVLSEELYATVERQVEVGEVSPVELKRAQVERSRARIQAQRARQRLHAERQQLAAAMGRQAFDFQGVRGTLEAVAPVPALQALQQRLGQTPALARWTDEQRQREAQLTLEKALRFPDPVLRVGVQRFGELDQHRFVMGVSFPLLLFDRNQGGVQEARYRLSKVQQQQRTAAVRLHAELETAYRELVAAHAEVVTLRSDVLPAAQSAFASIEEGYRRGKFDFLDVLDAQRTYFDVRLQYVDALVAYQRSKAEVERLIAAPLSDLNAE